MGKEKEARETIKHREWAEMRRAQQESGKTVKAWCAENGISSRAFHYRIRKLREENIEKNEKHEIVPLRPKEISKIMEQGKFVSTKMIRLNGNGIIAELPTDISPELLMTIVRGLREC